MSNNTPSAVEGSELSPRDEPYELSPPRVPQSIDGEPYEAAAAALAEYDALLIELIGYAEKVEALVRSAMLSEALTLPDDGPLAAGDVTTYPERTYELEATARAGKALGLAEGLVHRARQELDKPVAESRRLSA